MPDPITIAVDANGADLGPAEVARGAAEAVAGGDVRVLLFAPAGEVGETPPGVEVVDSPVSIAKAPDPARAVRSTPEASIVRAVAAVTEGRAAAVVSGGSTGAALAASLFGFRRARGVHRPALAVVVPAPRAPFLLLDAGANVEVRPEHLVQFAHMGAAFMEVVLGMERPRVALLSNGEEPAKGTPEVVAAHEALRERGGHGLNFIGNVEGFAIGTGVADVIVADGFAGNVALKVMEGTVAALMAAIRDAATSSPRAKAGGMLLRPSLRGVRDGLDPQAVGGAVLLGLRHLAVVPHGSFTARGFARAIEVAARGVREDLLGRTNAHLAGAGALRQRSERGEQGEGALEVASEPAATVPDQP
jgi:glycerol-3-phosphate acyltransferase PlsX